MAHLQENAEQYAPDFERADLASLDLNESTGGWTWLMTSLRLSLLGRGKVDLIVDISSKESPPHTFPSASDTYRNCH